MSRLNYLKIDNYTMLKICM